MSEFPAGTLINHRYRVRAVIGSGGMGVVYAVADERIGNRVVALKVPDVSQGEDVERCIRETKNAGMVRSENVVRILDADVIEGDGRPFLVMEIVDGAKLDSYVGRMRRDEVERVDVREACKIGFDIAVGLQAAHSVGIVHRDLTPRNVMVSASTGKAKIVDFGLSHFTADSRLTRAGVFVGSYHFMPAEQAKGCVTPKADVYALSSILFWMLTNMYPFSGDGIEVITKKSSGPAPSVGNAREDLPDELVQLIDRGLSMDVEMRPDASEMAKVLAKVGRSLSSLPDPKLATIGTGLELPPEEQRKGGAWRWGVILSTGLIVAILILPNAGNTDVAESVQADIDIVSVEPLLGVEMPIVLESKSESRGDYAIEVVAPVEIAPVDPPRREASRRASKRGLRKAPPPEELVDCSSKVKEVRKAMAKSRWSFVLSSLQEHSKCFSSNEGVRLRATAFWGLDKVKECLNITKGSRDPKTRSIRTKCESKDWGASR